MLSLFLFIVLFIVLLHWPYHYNRTWDFLGRESGEYRAALYIYRYGPTYEQLEYKGLRDIQRWVLVVVAQVATRLQPDIIAWFIEVLRQALGL